MLTWHNAVVIPGNFIDGLASFHVENVLVPTDQVPPIHLALLDITLNYKFDLTKKLVRKVLPPPLDFYYHTTGALAPVNLIQAYDGEAWIGQLTFNDGIVRGVWVREDYRREGIATTMLRIADHYHGSPLTHSNIRTKDGYAWSITTGHHCPEMNGTLGGYRPPLRKLKHSMKVNLEEVFGCSEE